MMIWTNKALFPWDVISPLNVKPRQEVHMPEQQVHQVVLHMLGRR